MPQPDSAQKVVHVTLSGKMLGGAEEWQTGFYVGSATADAPTPTQAWIDGVRDAWVTFFTAANASIMTSYTFEQAKAILLEKNGQYGANEPVVSFPATTKTGISSGAAMPPQVALVATLIGGSGKGLAGKGRMYLPGVNLPIDATGHINQTSCQNLANALAAFFNTIDGIAGGPGHAINVSRGHKLTGDFAGTYVGARNVKVNGVRVGNVYDTQRRRRNALNEVYSAAVVAD
jgi:hypothetical protein